MATGRELVTVIGTEKLAKLAKRMQQVATEHGGRLTAFQEGIAHEFGFRTWNALTHCVTQPAANTGAGSNESTGQSPTESSLTPGLHPAYQAAWDQLYLLVKRLGQERGIGTSMNLAYAPGDRPVMVVEVDDWRDGAALYGMVRSAGWQVPDPSTDKEFAVFLTCDPQLAPEVGVAATLPVACAAAWESLHALIDDICAEQRLVVDISEGYGYGDRPVMKVRYDDWRDGATLYKDIKSAGWQIAEPSSAEEFAVFLDRAPKSCKKCSGRLDGAGYCDDETCPYSSWPQRVELDELFALPTAALEAKYGVAKREVGVADEVEDENVALCEEHDVALVEAEEPELNGEWNWLTATRAADRSFPSRAACAADAVAVLSLKPGAPQPPAGPSPQALARRHAAIGATLEQNATGQPEDLDRLVAELEEDEELVLLPGATGAGSPLLIDRRRQELRGIMRITSPWDRSRAELARLADRQLTGGAGILLDSQIRLAVLKQTGPLHTVLAKAHAPGESDWADFCARLLPVPTVRLVPKTAAEREPLVFTTAAIAREGLAGLVATATGDPAASPLDYRAELGT